MFIKFIKRQSELNKNQKLLKKLNHFMANYPFKGMV